MSTSVLKILKLYGTNIDFSINKKVYNVTCWTSFFLYLFSTILLLEQKQKYIHRSKEKFFKDHENQFKPLAA